MLIFLRNWWLDTTHHDLDHDAIISRKRVNVKQNASDSSRIFNILRISHLGDRTTAKRDAEWMRLNVVSKIVQ